MSIPKTQKAVVTQGEKKIAVAEIEVPTPADDEILVKTHWVAINPTDWKAVDFYAPKGVVVGCDAAGEVVAVGKAVKDLKVGDRVGCCVWGSSSPNCGAFSQYFTAAAKLVFKVPDNVDLKDASTLGIAWITNVQTFHQSLELPTPVSPAKSPITVLIWSGATSVGQIGIQFAKAAGLRVITTASPKNFEHLKSLGADVVFDYKDANVVEKIQAAEPNLSYAFDCISEGPTTKFASDAFGPQGGKVSLLLQHQSSDLRKDVKTQVTLAYTMFGREGNLGGLHLPTNPKDRAVAEEFWPVLPGLLASGKIKAMPTKVFPGGLQAVSEAFDFMKSGKHSGEKLVINVSETQ